MKVMFDTNIYISFIRNRSHASELVRGGTVKYVSAIVLMELWAGAGTKKAERLLSQLQRPYESANRIVTLNSQHYIIAGQFFSDFAFKYRELCKKSDFVNDVQIALTALSIGATLYTENVIHFEIIRSKLKSLKLEYLTAEGRKAGGRGKKQGKAFTAETQRTQRNDEEEEQV